jgi:hypothetical protein
MLRNFTTQKSRPPRPTRFCLKSAGPGEEHRTNSPITSMGMKHRARIRSEIATSQARRAREVAQVLAGALWRQLPKQPWRFLSQAGIRDSKSSSWVLL